jgi:hypothetical protein
MKIAADQSLLSKQARPWSSCADMTAQRLCGNSAGRRRSIVWAAIV